MRGPRVLVLAFVAAALVYTATGLVGASEGATLVARNTLQLAAAASAAALCARAAYRAQGMQRAGWAFMSAATGAWALGQAAWTWYEVVLDIQTPIPSWADVGFLSLFPLAAVGVVCLAHPRRARFFDLMGPVADGVLVAAMLFLLAWPIFLHHVYAAAADLPAAIVAIAYVVGDLVLVGLAIAVIGRAAPSSRAPPATLMAAFLLNGVADTALAVGILGEGYSTGGVLDVGWLLGAGAIALAALRATPPASPGPVGVAERALPIAAVAVGFASYGIRMHDAFDYVVQGSVFGFTAWLAIGRQIAHNREHARLARENAAAYERVAHAERIAGLGSWRLELATGRIEWSDTARDLLGIPPGTPAPDVEQVLAALDPATASKLRALAARGAAGEATFDVESLIPRADGERRWMKTASEPERAPDGSVVALRGTMQDIHERKLAQIAAEEAADFTETILDASPVVLVVADEHGRLVRWNRELPNHSGYSAEELAGMSIDALLAPADRERFEARRLDLLARGQSEREVQIVHRDGVSHPAYVVARRFGDPEHPLLLCSVLDLTALRREQAAREAATALTRAVFDAAPVMIVVTDPTGKLVEWNAELVRATGWTPEELSRMNALDLIAPDVREAMVGRLREVAEKGGASTETEIVLKDGTTRTALLVGRRFGDASTPRVLGVGLDISARKRAEEALRRNERLASLGTLVAGVAHEINNPLTYIRGGVEMIEHTIGELEKGRPDLAEEIESMRHDARAALRGIDRIAGITTGLRRIARAPGGARKKTTLDAILQEILPVAQPRLGPDVTVETDPRGTRPVSVNVEEISQVILNLLLNAGDAMREKGGVLRIATRDEAEDALLEVSDTGPGIPRDKQPHIFTPFFTTKPDGTGLGLSVSRSIVLDHGGDLIFESTPGHGATFRLRLPAAAREKEAT